MEPITVLGLIAAVFTTGSLLPQIIKVQRTKSCRDISKWMFSFFALGVLLWFIYGVFNQDIPIIIANFLAFLQALTIIIFMLKYK
jgi:MtN3 and saliva related transmembrane protein